MESRAIPTTIRSPPSIGDYVPLAEHQSHTPETFFGGKPVLYYHATGAKLFVPRSQCARLPFIPADTLQGQDATSGTLEGSEEEELVEQTVDLLVGSDTLTVFSQTSSTGLSIPYPLISIHAIKSHNESDTSTVQSVYMQLDLADGGADDDEFDTVELTIVPPVVTSSTTAQADGNGAASQPRSETSKLFDAISACADLHPDPPQDGDEDDEDNEDRIVFENSVDPEAVEGLPGVFRPGGAANDLPPPFPGSSGWITADNMHEYFDEEGNWIGGQGIGGELGEGAGRVRDRNEAETASQGGVVNGHGVADDSDSKRARTQ